MMTSRQFPADEISLSVGFGLNPADEKLGDMKENFNSDDLATIFEALFGAWLIESHVTYNVEYMHALSDRLYIGAAAGYGHASLKYDEDDTDEDGNYKEYWLKITGQTACVMPQIKYDWLVTRNGLLRLYSKGGVGIVWQEVKGKSDNPRDGLDPETGYCEKTDVAWHPAYQIYPIGADIGWDNFRFFMELGYGHQSFCQYGIQFLF